MKTNKILGRLLVAIVLIMLYAACNSNFNSGRKTINESDINDTVAIFEWSGMCSENKGTYNTEKYTEAQLKNTYELVFGIGILGTSVAFKPSEIEKLSIDSLNEGYSKAITHLKSLSIVDIDYWKNLKALRIREVEEMYELDKISIQAYTDSSVLLNNRFTEHCLDYANALTSGDTAVLMKAWKKFVNKNKVNFGDTVMYMNDFKNRYYSANRVLYAKVDLITFGWYNCANDYVFRVDQDGKTEAEFQKLFYKVDSDYSGCE